MTTDLLPWLPKLSGRQILVVGDLCLDEYIIGKAQRLSREAPVPVLEFQERFAVPGAACNPALNVQALGSRAKVLGVVGKDEAGQLLTRSLQGADIDATGVVVDPTRETTVKTRVLAHHLFPQQVVRVDRQQRGPLSKAARSALRAALSQGIADADAVLVSDYRSGVVDASLMAFLLSLTRDRRILVTVDAQGDFTKFREVSLLRCNREEAEGYLHRRLDHDASLGEAGHALQKRLGVARVVITRGADGISFVDATHGAGHIPAANRSEVYDVTGAGDTVIAVLTLALAAGAPLLAAAWLANCAAGQVVRKLGNATVTPAELATAIQAATPP